MGQGFESLQACHVVGAKSMRFRFRANASHSLDLLSPQSLENGFAGTPLGRLTGSQLHMVGIAQLAEHRIVVPGVVGSSPITHPILWLRAGASAPALASLQHWGVAKW